MLKKKSVVVKNCIAFCIDFSLISHDKSMQNLAKKRAKRFSAQKSTTKIVRSALLEQKIDFPLIFGLPLGARGPPRTSREPPRIPHCFHESSVASENGPGRSPGGPEGGPWGPPGHPQGTILGRILDQFLDQFCLFGSLKGF